MADYDSAYTGAQIDTGIGKAYTAVQPGDIDSSLSGSSENAVQNKVVKTALDSKGTYSKPSGGIPKTDLASAVQTSLGKADTAVQPETGKGLFSGSYNDLSDKPTIPSAYTLPTASSSTKGGVKTGDAISDATGYTACKVKDGVIYYKDTNTTYTGSSPIGISGATVSHANSGVTAASKGDTSNQTPTWGGTFKVPSGTVNATGHLTAFADHTVTIPNATATTSAAGLMSTTDKTKLDGIATGATAVTDQTVAGWGYSKRLSFGASSIAVSAWTSDNTYADYPYKATISGLTGVTSSMFAEVIFSPSDASSGNLAAVCSTGTGSVTVYAKGIPLTAVSVLGVVVWG